MRYGASLAALVLFLALAPVAPAAAQTSGTYSGSWIWIAQNGAHGSQNNVSQLTFTNNRSSRCCYARNPCNNVQFTQRGDVYTFLTNGQNFFEFAFPEQGTMVARFWHNRNAPGSPPDTITSMTQH
jgi:hypothetical protein